MLTKSGIRSKHEAGQTVYSEMAHLFFVTLDNNAAFKPGTGTGYVGLAGWGLSNTANFKNMRSYGYWTGTSYADSSSLDASYFQMAMGLQEPALKIDLFFAMAVHDGDVGHVMAVPEPQTYALLLLGLLALRLRLLRSVKSAA